MATKLAVLCPVGETVPAPTFQYAMAMVSYASQHGIRIEKVGVTERQLVQTARNVLGKGFLKSDCDWAFWMDSDHIFPAETIVQLMETAIEKNAKFVTGVYYQRVGKFNPVLWKKNPVTSDGKRLYSTPEGGNGKHKDEVMLTKEAYIHHHISPSPDSVNPFRADVCGFGCVLTHKEMFEKMEYPYFKIMTDICSEDFYFCVKAKESGFQLWADPRPRIGHIGAREVVYREKYFDLMKDKEIATIQI
jgi:hypothetical protein